MKNYIFNNYIFNNNRIIFNIILFCALALMGASCQGAARDAQENPTSSQGVAYDVQENPVANDLLWVAATEGNFKLFRRALKNGAFINAILLTGYTALMEAISMRRFHMAIDLLNRPEIDVNVTTKNGITALQLAAAGGFPVIVSKLVEKKASVHAADKYGKTALMRAADAGHIGIVELLTKASNVNGDSL